GGELGRYAMLTSPGLSKRWRRLTRRRAAEVAASLFKDVNQMRSAQQSLLTTRPLSPVLGAEIMGADLREPIDAPLAAQLQDIWHQNLVILLRDQKLSMEDQVRFAECFGPPATIHTPGHMAGHPAVMLISNVRENGKLIGALPDGEMNFHTDQCHQERPATASMLYAIEIPSVGGNTLFANA